MSHQIYILCLSNGRRKSARTYYYQRDLKKRGYFYTGQSDWVKHCSETEIKNEISYAKRVGLSYEIRSGDRNRSSVYRTVWRENNRPIFGMYLCAYCGRPVKEKKITVDHIVSVKRAKTHPKYQKDVNNLSNLCGACRRCNLKKGTKGGFWILKGKLYRHRIFRIMRFLLQFAIMAVILYVLYLVVLHPQEASRLFTEAGLTIRESNLYKTVSAFLLKTFRPGL